MATDAGPLVKFIATTRLGEKGQLTIPKEYRDELELRPGDSVAVLRVGRGLILMPVEPEFRRLCEAIDAAPEGAGLTEERLQATLPRVRQQIFARNYPKAASAEAGRGKPKSR